MQAAIRVEFRPTHYPPRRIRVTEDQLHGRACVIGRTCSGSDLVHVGRVYTDAPPGSPDYSWPVVAHAACMAGVR